MRRMSTPDSTQRLEALARSRRFISYALVRALEPNVASVAEAYARRCGLNDPYLHIVQRAEAEAITSGTAAPLVSFKPFSDAFMERQRTRTIAGRMGEALRRAPMGVAINVTTTGSADAEWANFDHPVRVSSMAFESVTLPTTSLDTIIVVTKELARSAAPGSIGVIERDLLNATARAEDAKLLSSEDAIDQLRPAGLLNGLDAIGGGSPGSVEDDLAALVAAVRDGEPEAPYFVTSQHGALFLTQQRSADATPVFPNVRLTDSGDIWGIPLLISPAAESKLVLIDAAAILYADAGVVLDRSEVASLQLSDSPVSGAASTVSLFQTNSIALKATHWVHWQKADDAVAYMDLAVGSP